MNNIISPVFQAVILISIALWIVYILVRVLSVSYRKSRFWFKYKLFRRPFKDEDVVYVMETMDRGIPKIELKKHMMIKGSSQKKIDEIMYVYDQVMKEKEG